MKIIDLTHTISPDMPCFPGDEAPRFESVSNYETDGFKESLITISSHTGTHVDPPAHIFPNGRTLDSFSISQFVGKALVIDCRDVRDSIEIERVKRYGEKAILADFLLFNLGWDKRWGSENYFGDYPCISQEIIDFVKDTHKKGIGFDVISLDAIADSNLTRHKALFQDTDILNFENLKNLSMCGDDLFWFFALPLKLENCDGAPVRAVAFWE